MRKFGRKKQNREMMIRNLVTSLIIFEKVKTTQAKAKEIKPILDKLINIAKKNDLASRRKLLAYLLHKNAVKKVFEDLIERFADRLSGFSTSYHLAPRVGDGSKMMLLTLLPAKKTIKESKEKDNKSNNKSAVKVEKSKTKAKVTVRTKNDSKKSQK